MEAATQKETRRLLAALDVAFYLSLAALAAYLVLRWQPIDGQGTKFICTTDFRFVWSCGTTFGVCMCVHVFHWVKSSAVCGYSA